MGDTEHGTWGSTELGAYIEREKARRDWIFLGVYMTQVEFAVAMAKKKQGVCPFCGRTGLTPRYGSINKHIKACAKKGGNNAR